MDPAKYEYQSEFARWYFAEGQVRGEAKGKAEGKAEGMAEGKVELVLKQLALRFGQLSDSAVERVRAATTENLDVFAERVLTAQTLAEVLGSD